MAEDTRNYIELTQARAQAYHGKEFSPEEMATEFAKAGMDARVDILDNLDRDLSASGRISIDEAANQLQYVRALRRTHETLRKVDR
jgi:hypothetical protein